MPNPKRLAITISGAVSLGSFEAGVLFEVLTALAQHNATAAPADKILVDVVTGASAGAMTAVITAQILAGNGSRTWAAADNPFYNAWVKNVDLRGLVQLGADEDPMHSLLSSNAVERIAIDAIPERWGPSVPHPVAAPELKLGLALTNLVGIDVAVPSPTGTPFLYTKYEDRLTADIRRTDQDDWLRLRAAALASGAFPVAFRVRELLRSYTDYFPKASGVDWTKPYAYTDGGVFDNQPLGLARELVDVIDEPWDNDRRFYLFVSPSPKTSSIADIPLRAKDANFTVMLKALIGAVFNQARFRDWVSAVKVNDSLALLDDRAIELAGLLDRDRAFGAQLGPVVAKLAAFFVQAKIDGGGDVTLDSERDRLRRVFALLTPVADIPAVDYYAKLAAADPALAAAWIDALLVFEYAAELEDCGEMVIYGVTATDDELASGAISAFAGFFDERFREHDYQVGRAKARAWLATMKLAAAPDTPSLAPINYTPDVATTPAPDPKLRGLALKDMPTGPRKMLRDAITQRTDRLIDDNVKIFAVGWLVRSILKSGVSSFVGKQLAL